MRKFIRLKVELNGHVVWLQKDPNVDGWWRGTDVKSEAYQFSGKIEALETLLKLKGQWLNRGKIVHVRAYPKVKDTQIERDGA